MSRGHSKAWAKLFGLVAFSVLPLTACSTSVQTRSASLESNAVAVERLALQDAAEAVRETRWTKPEKKDLSALLAGVIGDSGTRFTRENAIVEYVALLNREADPVLAINQDIEKTLHATDELIAVSKETADALNPRMSDVALLESAIADLGETKSIYLSALSFMERDRKTDDIALMRGAVKESFSRKLSWLGDVADELADRAHKERKETIAARKNAKT